MPRLFTHLENRTGSQQDSDGQEFAGIDAALRDAARTAGGMLTEDLTHGHSPVHIGLVIEDASGRRLATIVVDAWIERATAG